MCGRFAQFSSGAALEAHFDATLGATEPVRRYNIAPGAPVLAVGLSAAGERTFAPLHWGLIPSWSKDRKIASRTINARAESVAEKPAFRAAFRHARCLIPANGFYEWKRTATGKQPYFITLADRSLFAFAGLWECWTDPESDERIHSCTIIVTEANTLVSGVHDRMPVILRPEDYGDWLDRTQTDPARAKALLRPFDPDAMRLHPVAPRVGSARLDDPSLIEPLTSGTPDTGSESHQ